MKKKLIAKILILIILSGVTIPAFRLLEYNSVAAEEGRDVDFWDLFNATELKPGEYFTMVDEQGETVMRTARKIFPGDEYLNSDNHRYRVNRVEGHSAYASLVEVVEWGSSPASSNRPPLNSQPVQGEGSKKIDIYSTHGAESYLPEDGTESDPDGQGGIFDVAAALKQNLEEQGVEVQMSNEPHVPHDAGAYQRSRRTAEELVKDEPDALIDVHRDAVPAEEYLAEVAGEETVQVQLVVGQQNQNAATTREFAESLKQTADQTYPGLVKGIFTGRGNYNQDMHPRAILIEVGSHENSKEQAQESMDKFSEVLVANLYGEGGQAQPGAAARDGGGTALSSILWVLGIVIVGVAVYLLVSTGSWEELVSRVRHFLHLPEKVDGGEEE